MRPGKVWMDFDDGTSGWVPASRVREAQADGGKIAARVKMKVDLPGGPIVREFDGNKVPFNWQEKGEVMGPDDTTQGTSFPQAVGSNVRSAIAGLPRIAGQSAAMMIPGVGMRAAALRALTTTGAAGAGDVLGRAIEGSPQDLGGSLGFGGMSAAWGLPFEAAAALLPKRAPGMMASSMKPSKSQQKAAQNVEARQSGQRAAPDYERLGKQALEEGVRPTREGIDAELIRTKNETDNAIAEGILPVADARGFEVTAPELVRSPEVRAVMRDLSKQTNRKEALKEANAFLRSFMRDRASRAVQPRPTGVLDAQGNMRMTKKVPAVPEKMRASGETGLNQQKRTWRKEAAPVMKARANNAVSGVGPQQSIQDRLSDALARAAKSRLDAITVRRPDPEDPTGTRHMGFKDFNERIERRIPLADALEDFQTRPNLTMGEGLMRLLRGHAPTQELEGLLAQKFFDPRFIALRHFGPYSTSIGTMLTSQPKDQ